MCNRLLEQFEGKFESEVQDQLAEYELHYSLQLAVENFKANAVRLGGDPKVISKMEDGITISVCDTAGGMDSRTLESFGHPIENSAHGLGIDVYLRVSTLEYLGLNTYVGTMPGEGTTIFITS